MLSLMQLLGLGTRGGAKSPCFDAVTNLKNLQNVARIMSDLDWSELLQQGCYKSPHYYAELADEGYEIAMNNGGWLLEKQVLGGIVGQQWSKPSPTHLKLFHLCTKKLFAIMMKARVRCRTIYLPCKVIPKLM